MLVALSPEDGGSELFFDETGEDLVEGSEVLGGVASGGDLPGRDGSEIREASRVDLHGEDSAGDLNPVEPAEVVASAVGRGDGEEDPGDRGLDPGLDEPLGSVELGSGDGGDGGGGSGGVHGTMLCPIRALRNPPEQFSANRFLVMIGAEDPTHAPTGGKGNSQ